MKRITLVLLLLMLTGFGYSQTENFEGGIPGTWAVFNNGIGTNTWTTTSAVTTPPTVCEGTTSAFMNARQNIGAGNTSQNYLVTPLITVPTNGQLIFSTRSTINGPDNTTYQVRYSTTSQTDINSFTTIQSWADTDLTAVFNICEEKTVSLSGLSGQQVYLAFVVVMNQPAAGLTGDRWIVDDLRLVEQCIDPTDITVGGITQNSASISWLNPGGATQFEVEVVQVPNAPTGVGVLTGPSPFVANGLSPTTQYQVYVRAVCSQSNSAWVGPTNFLTTSPGVTCEAPIQITSLPYSTTDNTGNYGDDYNGPQGPAAGCGTATNYLTGDDVFYSFTAPTTGVVNITMTPTGTWSGIFVYNSCTNIGVSCIAGVGNSANTPRVIDLPVTAGQTYFIVISTNTAPQSVGYTLTLQIVNCPPPTGLTAGNIGQTSAELSWANPGAATSWEVAVQPAGSPIPTGAGVTANTNTNFPVSGLTAATAYQYYVRADCGDGTFSAWAGPFLFNTTICEPGDQCNYTFVLRDSFGDGWNGATMQVRQNGIVVATLGTTFTAGGGPINITVPLCNGLPFDLFWNAGGTFAGEVRVQIINPFNQTLYNMTTASAGLVNSVLYAGTVDCDFPACLPPSGVTVTNIGGTSAQVGWTAIPGITQYEVIVLPAGSPAPTAASTGTVTSDNPFTINGLTSATLYDVYVRAICSTPTPSNWTPVTTFNTTLCEVADQCLYTFRMRDSFGDGWNGARMQVRQNGIVIATIGATFNAGAGPIDVQVPLCNGIPFDLFWSVGGTFAGEVRVEIINPFAQSLYNMNTASAGLVNTVLYSGLVDCLNPECIAPLNVTTSNIGINQISVGWNPNGGTNFEVIAVPAGSPAPTLATPGIPATSNPFVVTGLNPSTAYDFYVRALCTGNNPASAWAGPATATTLPTCPQPINLTVLGADTNTATLSWTNIAPATLFEIVVQPVGSGVPTVAGVITSQNPYTATGLSAGFYEFYVRAICSASDISAWAGPQNFFILAALPGCAGVDIDLQTSTPGVLNLCPGESCVDLSASFFETGDTTTYEVTAIPFTPPFPFTGGIPTSVNTDDVWSPAIPLPFNFCFFGQNYTQALVGSNGVITFDIQGVVPGGAQAANGYCAWPFTQTIPNAGFPIKAAIYGPYQDINPNVTTPPAQPSINYQVLGTAPCRVLVVNFSEVAQFSCNTNVPLQTSQIVLYETSNAIEVYVQNRVPCLTWNSGNGVIGIQNQAGTQAHVPLGRNTGTWSASNEAWRFTPAGPSNVTFSWLKDGEFYSNNLNINVCVTETTSMTAQAIYTACGGAQTITTDTILLNVVGAELEVQDDVTVCEADGYELPALLFGNYFTETNGGGTQLNAGDVITTPQTIYVYAVINGTNGTCSTEGSFQVNITDEIVPEFNAFSTFCVNEVAPGLPATSTNGVNGLWEPSTISTAIPGTFTYTFTPFGGESCATSTTIDITVNEEITPTFDAIPDLCQGSTAPALPTTSTNDITGVWSPATIDTATSGTFTFTFTPDAGQCAAIVTLDVTIASEIIPTFDAIPTLCQNSEAPILPSTSLNGVIGTWSPSTIDTSVFGVATYTFTPDASEECAVSATLDVTVEELVTPTFDPIAVICQNSSAPTLPLTSLNGITGTWSPDTIDSSVAGITTFTFTPEAGVCATTYTVDITVEEELTPTFDPIADLCLNATAPSLPATSTNGVNGTWSPSTIDTSVAGQFTFIFTPDAGVCATQGSLIVNVSNSITPTFTAYPTLCQFSEAPLLPASSDNGVTGTWLPSTIDTSVVGDSNYTFTPDASFECALPVTITVTVEERITPTFAAIASICLNGVAPALELVSTNGISGTWNPAAIDTSVAGSVVYTFTPADGICASQATLTVEITAPTQATFTQVGPFCQNDTVASLPTTSLEGVTGTWNSSTIDTSVAGDFVYTFTPTSGLCALGTTMTITITAPTQAVFTQIANLCQGSTAPLLPQTSNNGVTGSWNPSTINTANAGITTYIFTPTTGLCALGTTMTIEVFATPVVDQIAPQTICQGQSYTLPALSSGNAYFTGPNGSGLSLAEGSTVSSSQTIYIYAQSGTVPNCTAESSFTVTVVEVVAQELSDVQECGGFVLPTLDAGNVYYTGPNGTGTQLQAGSEVTTTQTIYILATSGACTAESSFEVTIVGCAIQKGISPNGDGLNDFFDLANFNVRNLSIFNRYGVKVYSRGNYENEWYGQSDKGDDLPDGTYYYVIEFSDNPTKTGWIYINRER